MKLATKLTALLLLTLLPAMGSAQLSLPGVGPTLPLPDRTISDIARPVIDPVTGVVDGDVLDRLSKSELKILLNRLRIDRINRFLRENRDYVERDRNGEPAVRGVLIATDISETGIQRAVDEGYKLLERGQIDGLEVGFVKFSTRTGKSLKSEQKRLQKIAGKAEISADNIYFTSGSMGTIGALPLNAALLASSSAKSANMGLIDGGVARHRAITVPVEQRGFAKGAPTPSNHGSAIASLISGSQKTAARGLLAADVYGNDPAGGNAMAIARALGWMAQRKIAVVTISLVGPDNDLLNRAIKSAQGKGMLIVAAVGNDGPAAPPRFPAAYKGVIGVTGVDRRQRALPEAGIASQVDFSAPGADMSGASPDGKMIFLRGTSFAAPLVATRLASYYPATNVANIRSAINALIREAKDLGKKGPDKIYGNGLVCENCASR